MIRSFWNSSVVFSHVKGVCSTLSYTLTQHVIHVHYCIQTHTHTHTHTHAHTHTHRDIIDLQGIQMDLAGIVTEQGEDVDQIGQCLFTCTLIIMFEIENWY